MQGFYMKYFYTEAFFFSFTFTQIKGINISSTADMQHNVCVSVCMCVFAQLWLN